MAQQTAVEWLREQYVHITWMVNRDELPTDTVFEFMLNRFEQAKQMFEEQVKKAYSSWPHYKDINDNGDFKLLSAQQYYNETYGK